MLSEVLRITGAGQAFNRIPVLTGINLALETGERLAVIGSSGSGKTTLLRLIAGFEPPTKGEITIANKLVSRAGQILVPPEHRQIAMVFQGLALFPHLRALDQIAFTARGRGGLQHAKALLERIGLGHRSTARLDELSGGERQRIALARAIAQQPKLVLMDEPFSSLDDEKRSAMRDLLRSLLESTEATLILVTHSRDDALDLARQTLVLEQGYPVAYGTLESILLQPQHRAAVRAFGLGQVIDGQVQSDGTVSTAFGPVSTNGPVSTSTVQLLVRPAQPRIVFDGTGVNTEVVRLDLLPPESGALRKMAVVRAANHTLRVFVREEIPAPGNCVQVKIEGPCDQITG